MLRRIAVAAAFSLLLAADLLYFGQRGAASLMRWEGERAFYAGQHARALRFYELALQMPAGDRRKPEADIVELLLIGLDQDGAGLSRVLPLPPSIAVERIRDGLTALIRRSPHAAYYWSLVSDLSLYEARRRRRASTVDLSALSDDPLENLLPEELQAIAALEMASRLEPNNYLYHDLLVEQFLELGSPAGATPHVRDGVEALPDFDEHLYLQRRDLPPVILEAALEGFEAALARPSLLTRATIRLEAARLLQHNGRLEASVPLIEAALQDVPGSFQAHYMAGAAALNLQDHAAAVRHLTTAARLGTDDPWAHYILGLALQANGDRDRAIAAFTRARELAPRDVRFFHRLAEALEESGRTREAERQYVAAANLNPGETAAWLALLSFYERSGDEAALAGTCRRLADLHPDEAAYEAPCRMRSRGTP